MKNLTDRIRKLKFNMTELADYLDISRATMYRYVASYEQGHPMDISELSLKIFDYIMQHNNLNKMDVVYFIADCKRENMKQLPKEDLLKKISAYLDEYPDSFKSEMLMLMFNSKKLDDAIDFIMNLSPYLDDAGNIIEGGVFDTRPTDSYFHFHEYMKRKRNGVI